MKLWKYCLWRATKLALPMLGAWLFLSRILWPWLGGILRANGVRGV